MKLWYCSTAPGSRRAASGNWSARRQPGAPAPGPVAAAWPVPPAPFAPPGRL